MVWSSHTPIIVNEELFAYYWTDILAGIITIYGMFFFIKELKKKWNDTIDSIKLFLIVIASPFIIPFMVKTFFEQSLMLLFHELSLKENSTKLVKMQKKISFRTCRNGVVLEDNYIFSSRNGEICHIPDEIYSKLIEGDELIIKGESSYFGFTTDSIAHKPKPRIEIDSSPDADWKKRKPTSYKVLY